MAWLALVVGVPLVAVAAVALRGVGVPRRHVATVAATLPGEAIETWKIVSDPGAWPVWNRAVTRAARADDAQGRETWRIEQRGRGFPLRVVERRPPVDGAPGVVVLEIAGDGLPFGGCWRWEIAAAGRGVDVRLVEDGHIDNPVFRALAHHVFGYTRTCEEMLRALARHRGATVVVRSGVTHPGG